jgi:uncharacterized protein
MRAAGVFPANTNWPSRKLESTLLLSPDAKSMVPMLVQAISQLDATDIAGAINYIKRGIGSQMSFGHVMFGGQVRRSSILIQRGGRLRRRAGKVRSRLQISSGKFRMYAVLLLSCLGFLYLLFAPRISPALYRSVLFHPMPLSAEDTPPELEGVTGEDVVFGQEKHYRLNGWYYRLPKSRFVVLVSHGNGGNISIRPSLLEAILQSGCSVFIYDYCGYGKSEGSPDLQNIVEAGECAYHYLITKQGYKPEDIIVYGESLGAAVSACLAERCKTGGLIIQSGFSSLYSIAVEAIPFFAIYPRFLFPDADFDTANRVARLKVPILVIHGTLDEIVPVHHGRNIYDSASEPKTILILDGAGHNDITDDYRDEFVKAVRKFVSSLAVKTQVQ